MGRKAIKNKSYLTDLELKVMSVIWRLRSATVQDIAEQMKKESFAYTTLSTVCRLLENQKILESVKNGRSHIYVPVLQKEDYESKALEQVVKNVFESEPSALVRRLIQNESLSLADLAELRELIEVTESLGNNKLI